MTIQGYEKSTHPKPVLKIFDLSETKFYQAVIKYLPWILIAIVIMISYLSLKTNKIKTSVANINIPKAHTTIDRVRFINEKFINIWLTSSRETSGVLKSVCPPCGTVEVENPTYRDVYDFNMISINRKVETNRSVTWSLIEVLSADRAQYDNDDKGKFYTDRLVVKTTLVERKGGIAPVSLPYIVNFNVPQIKVSRNSNIAIRDEKATQLFSDFLNAFYVDQKEDSYKRLITNNFHETQLEIPGTFINVTVSKMETSKPLSTTDKSRQIVVTAKLYITPYRFITVQIPINITKSSTGQWLIDSFSETAPYGSVERVDGSR